MTLYINSIGSLECRYYNPKNRVMESCSILLNSSICPYDSVAFVRSEVS